MAKHTDGVEMYYAKDKESWHRWLKKNHTLKNAVWLIYYKPVSDRTRVSYNDAVDEAICFGWIDSKPNKLDELRSMQLFARRRPKSNWSKINKQRVQRLIEEKRMQTSGLVIVEQAKQNGTWDALNEVENMVIPSDLQKALNKDSKAKAYFMTFPKSSTKNILEWILNARKKETRSIRIKETVRLAKNNIRANHYRQPKG